MNMENKKAKALEKLEQNLKERLIERRDFMRGAMAMGLGVAGASALADKAEAAAPKMGGRFRQGLTGGGSGDSLDPATINDSYMQNVSYGQLRNCLTESSAANKLTGELAESWESSSDAKTWTFKLRRGVEFHNGKTLDSTDVAESINHHRGDDTKSAAKGIVSDIAEIRTDGANTVVFKMSNSNADLPYLLSDYHLSICPAKSGGGIDWQSGVGTGGYTLKSFDPGVKTVTTRNPNYWKAGFAHFAQVESLFISDVNARTNALKTGELDGMMNPDPKTVHLLKRDPNLQLIQATGNKHVSLPMHTDTAPFDNNDVRLALKYSVNREEWRDKIFRGYAAVGNDTPIGPANEFQATTDEIPQRQYDPDKAKFHLKKAGMSALNVEFHAGNSAFEGAVDAGQLYAESAKTAGINIKIVRAPDDGYWDNTWLVKPWCASYWSGRATENWMFSQVYKAGADWNETKFNHDRFEKLLAMGNAETNPSKRREIYVEMQRIVHDEGGAVIPLFISFLSVATSKVHLPDQIGSNWGFDGEKAAERWWFA